MLGIGGTAGGSARVRVGTGGFTGLAGRGAHTGTSVPGWRGENPQVLAAPIGMSVGPGAAAPPARHMMDG